MSFVPFNVEFPQSAPSRLTSTGLASGIAPIVKPKATSVTLANPDDIYGAAPVNYRLRRTVGTLEHAMASIRNRYSLSLRDEQTVKDYLWGRGGKSAEISTETLYETLNLIKQGKLTSIRRANQKVQAGARPQRAKDELAMSTARALNSLIAAERKTDASPEGQERLRVVVDQSLGALSSMGIESVPNADDLIKKMRSGKLTSDDAVRIERLAKETAVKMERGEISPAARMLAASSPFDPQYEEFEKAFQLDRAQKFRSVIENSEARGLNMALSGVRRVIGGVAAPEVMRTMRLEVNVANQALRETRGMSRAQKLKYLEDKGFNELDAAYTVVLSGKPVTEEFIRDQERMLGDLALAMLTPLESAVYVGSSAQSRQAAQLLGSVGKAADVANTSLPIARGLAVMADPNATEEEKANAIADSLMNVVFGTRGGRYVAGAPFRAAGKGALAAHEYIKSSLRPSLFGAKTQTPKFLSPSVPQTVAAPPAAAPVREPLPVVANDSMGLANALKPLRRAPREVQAKPEAPSVEGAPNARVTPPNPEATPKQDLTKLSTDEITGEITSIEKKLREASFLDVGPRDPNAFVPEQRNLAGLKEELAKRKAKLASEPKIADNEPNVSSTQPLGSARGQDPSGRTPGPIRGNEPVQGVDQLPSPEASRGPRLRGQPRGEPQHTVPGSGRTSDTPGPETTPGNRTKFRIESTNSGIGVGGPAVKRSTVLDGVKLLRELETTGRAPTDPEKAALSRFAGWGWTGNLLNPANAKPSSKNHRAYKMIADALDKNELSAARSATVNSHFTDPKIIDGLWSAVRKLGFEQGKALEPSAGVGLIPSLGPKNVDWDLVELDSVTGRILSQIHNSENVQVTGFQNIKTGGGYDLAISNVPFSSIGVRDVAFTKKTGRSDLTSSLHNYFVTRMIDETRPGGLTVAITSNGTLDAPGSASIREWMRENAELVGAIRLPRTAFKGNASTEVVTDILFFRKLEPGEEPKGETFTNLVEVETKDGGKAFVNEYYARYPDMALGDHALSGKMYRANSYTLEPNGDLLKQLEDAVSRLPEGVFKKVASGETAQLPSAQKVVTGNSKVRDGALIASEGKVKIAGSGETLDLPKTELQKAESFIGVRDSLNNIISAMRVGVGDDELRTGQKALEKAYNAYVKKHGPLHRNLKQAPWLSDPDAYMVLSLEKWDSKKKVVTGLADIFTKRVIEPDVRVDRVENATDAIVASLINVGKVDFDEMARVTGRTVMDLQGELVGKLVFQDHASGKFVTAEDFGSGNVVKKLDLAQRLGDADAVAFLKTRQPTRVMASDIKVSPGAPWIPTKTYSDFISGLLEDSREFYKVNYNKVNGQYVVSSGKVPRWDNALRSAAASRWTDTELDLGQLLSHMLNNKVPRIVKFEKLDEAATAAAQAKLLELRRAFDDWVMSDDARSLELEDAYNQKVNVYQDRDYDGSHLTFPGMNPAFKDRQHRKNAVWRFLQEPAVLLAHDVGTGKTATMQAAAMEGRRTGIIKKPLHVVKNSMVDQYAGEFYNLYPGARLLVVAEDSLTPAKRKETIAQIATGDWDSIIIPFTKFYSITSSPETQARFFREQIQLMEEFMFEIKNDKDQARTVKQVAKSIDALKTKLGKLQDKSLARQDKDATFFDDLGIDSIFVDEAHNFKNLAYQSSLQVKGLGNPQGSQRAFDMALKVDTIIKDGGRVVFATGTPISNTIGEVHTMLKYLAPDALEDLNIKPFDAWANSFARITSDIERSVDGTFKESRRFTQFMNLPELLQPWRRVVDTVFTEDVKGVDGKPALKIPQHVDMDGNVTGKPIIVESKPTQAQIDYWKKLVERARSLKGVFRFEKGDDNMLAVATDGRKSATDIRLAVKGAADHPETKINKAAANIAEVYKRHKKDKATQIVFLDYGVPDRYKSAPVKAKPQADDDAVIDSAIDNTEFSKFSLYDDLKEKLIKSGIPENQIAFFQDAKTDKAKAALQQKVRDGEIRVLIGTTAGMGEGLNVQTRLKAIHHMNAGWKPADMDQRNGRIFRQGNMFVDSGVMEFQYVTVDSFDAFMWAGIRRKSEFIRQLLKAKIGTRVIEDVGSDDAMSIAEIEAAASGNPEIAQMIKLEVDVAKLGVESAGFAQTQRRNKSNLQSLERELERLKEQIPKLESVVKEAEKNTPEKFELVVGGKKFTKHTDAGLAVLDEAKGLEVNGAEKRIGSYAGMSIYLTKQSQNTAVSLRDSKTKVESFFLIDNLTLDDVTPAPSVASRITAQVKKLSEMLEKNVKRSQFLETEIPKMKSQIGGEFPKAAELKSKEAKLLELRSRLTGKDSDVGGWGSGTTAVDAEGVTFGQKLRPLPASGSGATFDKGSLGNFMSTAPERAKAMGATSDDLVKRTAFDDDEIIAARYISSKKAPTVNIDTPERHAVREQIADAYQEGAKGAAKEKKVFIVTGLPGSGKSSVVINKLIDDHKVFVIDSDDIKPQLPEFDGGFGGAAVSAESTFIGAIVQARLIREGVNLAIPTLGRSAENMRRLLDELKANKYEVHLRHVDVPVEVSVARATSRAKDGGQGFIDPEFILSVEQPIKEVISKYKGEFDSYEIYDTRERPPRLIESNGGIRRDGVNVADAEKPGAQSKGSPSMGAVSVGEGEAVGQVPRYSKTQPGTDASVGSGRRIAVEPIYGANPKNLRDIIANLGKISGPKKYGSKVNVGMSGEFNPKTGMTKIRFSGDLDVTSHELGHELDSRFEILKPWDSRGMRSPYDGELKEFWEHGSIASSGPRATLSYKRAEGLAEFMRAYIVNPEAAKQKAPNFFNYLAEKIDQRAFGAIDSFSDDVRRWSGLDASDQILSNTSVTRSQRGIRDKLTKELLGDGFNFKITAVDRLQALVQDSLTPLMRGIRFALDASGKDSPLPEDDPRVLVRLFQGLNGKIGNIFERGMINATTRKRVTPGGIDWLMQPFEFGKDRARAETLKNKTIAYMIAERTIGEARRIETIEAENVLRALNGEPPIKNRISSPDRLTGIGAGIYDDQDVARRMMKQLDSDLDIVILKEGAKRYRAWADSLLQYMVDSGRMSQDTLDKIKLYDVPYVALHRVFEGMEGSIASIPSKKKAIGKVGDPVKRFTGSTREINDPYANLISQTWAIVKEADRNAAMASFVRLLSGPNEAPLGGKVAEVGNIAKAGDKNTIKVFVKGKAEFWQFQEDVYKALKGIGEIDAPNILDAIVRTPGRILRSMVVYSPGFIIRNPIRDTFDRSVKSRTGSGVRTVFKKQTAEDKANLAIFGADFSGNYFDSKESYDKALAGVIKSLAPDKTSIIGYGMKGVDAWKSISESSERRGRIDEFKTAFKHARDVLGYDDVNAQLYAAAQSRDVIDFAVAGTVGRWVNRYVPFTNPAIQGVSRFLVGAKENPAAFMARWALFVAMPSVAVHMWNQSQGEEVMDEIRQQPAYIRDFFWNIKVGPNLWLRIPKPFELGVLASGIERTLDQIRPKKVTERLGASFEGYGGSLAKALIPVDETAVFGPIRALVESRSNYDFFRDKAIVPPYEEELALDLRKGTKDASRLGKALGGVFNTDPRKSDHFVQSQFAEIGRILTGVSDIGRDDKDKSLAQWLGLATGLFVQSPAYNSVDAQWVMKFEKSLGVKGDDSLMKPYLDTYFDKAKTDRERDVAAAILRDQAKALRSDFEQARQVFKTSENLKEYHKGLRAKRKSATQVNKSRSRPRSMVKALSPPISLPKIPSPR